MIFLCTAQIYAKASLGLLLGWQLAARTAPARDAGSTEKMKDPLVRLPWMTVRSGACNLKDTSQSQGQAGSSSTLCSSSSAVCSNMYVKALLKTAKWSEDGG
mmetsp:Transcript_40608/g.77980  ORF Transcript_40608/g.77980 Transcript_40608/m.77980 type:complete len:102 (-) Transcript_40608:215-520(-)